jgi:hypothetical protein
LSDDPTEFTDTPIETGLVTATVTAPVELTPEAIQAAKALVNLPNKTPVELAQLARDIAQDIGMLPAILQKHNLTQAQYDWIRTHNKFYIVTEQQEINAWQGIKSTEVRLRLQAQAALEEQMPKIATRMGNAAEKLGDVVEAFKAVARIAGVDTPPAGPVTNGERYTINIDLGADTRIVIGAQGGANEGTLAPAAGALSTNGQRGGSAPAVRRNTEGPGNLLSLPAVPEG